MGSKIAVKTKVFKSRKKGGLTVKHLAKTDLKGLPFGAILGIAGIITLIGFFCPWAGATGASTASISGFQIWQGSFTFAGAWLIIVGSMISYNLFNSQTLEDLKPLSDSGLGVGGAVLGLIGTLAFLIDIPSMFSPAWGLYLPIVGGFFGLLSGIMLYYRAETGPSSRKRSGGL